MILVARLLQPCDRGRRELTISALRADSNITGDRVNHAVRDLYRGSVRWFAFYWSA